VRDREPGRLHQIRCRQCLAKGRTDHKTAKKSIGAIHPKRLTGEKDYARGERRMVRTTRKGATSREPAAYFALRQWEATRMGIDAVAKLQPGRIPSKGSVKKDIGRGKTDGKRDCYKQKKSPGGNVLSAGDHRSPSTGTK